jgi:hypothetical protein
MTEIAAVFAALWSLCAWLMGLGVFLAVKKISDRLSAMERSLAEIEKLLKEPRP